MQIARETDLDRAFRRMESHLHLKVAAYARNRIFVHAGVVALGSRAIVFPGTSGTGKSTLVEALLKAGATYYSDEYAVVDAKGDIHPFPRPLHLRTGPGGSRRVDASEYPAPRGTRPVRAGLVVFTEYDDAASGRLRPVAAGRATLSLLRNSVAARIAPERALDYLPKMIEGASLLTGKRGDVSRFIPRLLERLDE